jgi:hypothetical protein
MASERQLSRQHAVVVVATVLIAATFVLSIVAAASAFVRDVLAAPLRQKLNRSVSLSERKLPDFKSRFEAMHDQLEERVLKFRRR